MHLEHLIVKFRRVCRRHVHKTDFEWIRLGIVELCFALSFPKHIMYHEAGFCNARADWL
jgi:hypothetical protein